MNNPLTAEEFAMALKEAGIIEDGGLYRRIVIDVQVDCLVVIYLEKFTDKKLLSVVTDLSGIRIEGEALH